MKRLAVICSFLALTFAFAAPALANSACYDWDCDFDTKTCDFDASCTTFTQGSLWRYRWDFGDGGYPVLTGSATISHTYSISGAYVNLTVIPFSADNFEVECFITVYNVVGPPLPTAGRCQ